MNLAKLAGQPVPIHVNGETLLVTPGTPRRVARLQAWLAAQPPPGGQPLHPSMPPLVRAQVQKAHRQLDPDWPPDVATDPEGVRALCATDEGAKLLLAEALKPADPSFTDEVAEGLLDALPQQAMTLLVSVFMGWIDPETPDLPKPYRRMLGLPDPPESTGSTPTDPPAASAT